MMFKQTSYIKHHSSFKLN